MICENKNHLRVAGVPLIAATVLIGLSQLLFDRITPLALAGDRQAERPLANSNAFQDRPGINPLVTNATAGLLYDQTANVGLISTASQNLGFSSVFSSEAADDFIIPAGRSWTVQQVGVLGLYTGFSFFPLSVNVAIYSDLNGLPGSVVCVYGNLNPLDTEGDFVITLPSPCVLGSGHYWLEVQANSNTSPRRWFWTQQTVKSHLESVWRNPGGGFGTGCTTFMPVTACGVANDPDLSFQILGQEAPVFDYCIQDESNGNVLQLSSTTGDYQFSNCSGLTLSGTGIVIVKASTITLQHSASDRRVLAKIDGSSHRATAALQVLPHATTFSLLDRNIADSKCSCSET